MSLVSHTVATGTASPMAVAGRAIAALIWPPQCLACNVPVAEQGGLCSACWSAFAPIGPPLCDRLGVPLAHGGEAGMLSAEALADPPPFARCRAVAAYGDVAARLVHRLKYGDQPDLARWLGAWMARAGAELLESADVVIPVPLHRGRLWGRRYNQAALLAREIADVSEVPLDLAALRRRRATRSQVGLSAAQRKANLRGAFAVDGPDAAVRGRHVVLVDDVYTTGATAQAATRVLVRSGARQVDVIVFARVVRGRN